MTTFAIIPAKARSTRLPNKNIKEIFGLPMIVHVINNLKGSGLFDEIWVSTDGNNIKEVCERESVNVLFRPDNLATDRSTVNQVCQHWLESLDIQPDTFCCAYATSIFLDSSDYKGAHDLLEDGVEGVMGVSRYNYPPVQAMTEKGDGNLEMLMPEYEKVQSQFYPDCYVSNGSQYWLKTSDYIQQKTFYLNKVKGYVTDERRILDINTQADFDEAMSRSKMMLY